MKILTPRPIGDMPDGVRFSSAENPSGRLELHVSEGDLVAFDQLASIGSGTTLVTDYITGEQFSIRRAPCDAGCRCAAEARWVGASLH